MLLYMYIYLRLVIIRALLLFDIEKKMISKPTHLDYSYWYLRELTLFRKVFRAVLVEIPAEMICKFTQLSAQNIILRCHFRLEVSFIKPHLKSQIYAKFGNCTDEEQSWRTILMRTFKVRKLYCWESKFENCRWSANVWNGIL